MMAKNAQEVIHAKEFDQEEVRKWVEMNAGTQPEWGVSRTETKRILHIMNSSGAPGTDMITVEMLRNLEATHAGLTVLINMIIKGFLDSHPVINLHSLRY